MEGEAAGSSMPANKKPASKITRVALGVFVSSTVVLGVALFLGKCQYSGACIDGAFVRFLKTLARTEWLFIYLDYYYANHT